MTKQEAKELLTKYKANQASQEEIAWVESWYMNLNEDQSLELSEEDFIRAEREMTANLGINTTQPTKLWTKISIAASLILIAGLCLYSLNASKSVPDQTSIASQRIAPGGNNAVLILDNGQEVNLAKQGKGQLANQSGVNIIKQIEGQILYDQSAGPASDPTKTSFNTIVTPRGGNYGVYLQDGTYVYLNSASKIRFPTVFNGHDRIVEISGEAYFEVAPDHKRPFKVITNDQVVEVLGTKFNINNYDDEAFTATTLLQGKVKVTNSSKDQPLIMRPGQQARSTKNNKLSITEVNAEQYMAWKNGVFSFDRTDLRTVMRQFARWYNIDVSFEKNAPEVFFTGKIYKSLELNEALANLVFLDVSFHIKDRKVTVLPNIK